MRSCWVCVRQAAVRITAYRVDGDTKARLAVAHRDRDLVVWRMHAQR